MDHSLPGLIAAGCGGLPMLPGLTIMAGVGDRGTGKEVAYEVDEARINIATCSIIHVGPSPSNLGN